MTLKITFLDNLTLNLHGEQKKLQFQNPSFSELQWLRKTVYFTDVIYR